MRERAIEKARRELERLPLRDRVEINERARGMGLPPEWYLTTTVGRGLRFTQECRHLWNAMLPRFLRK